MLSDPINALNMDGAALALDIGRGTGLTYGD
jgi:hypothetical protein